MFFMVCSFFISEVQAQPAARRQQAQQQKSNAQTLTTRAQISFPTAQSMSEDVVWRRDIYREIDLTQDANAGLYYPVEPVGTQMNLFTYLFKLMLTGQVRAYEYRTDGNEVFTDSARVKPKSFIDNYHIYYERTDNGRIRIDDSDIPSREVKGYYLKESAYYDQASATFHTKVIALCPIMSREDDFGDGTVRYPLFWVKMSIDDYFTKNMYRGSIYKTTNMLGQTLAQYCPDSLSMSKEQKRIEQELLAFEKNIWGNQVRKDSLDSIANLDPKVKLKAKKAAASSSNRRASSGKSEKVKTKRASSSSSSSSGSSSARVTVRRQRH